MDGERHAEPGWKSWRTRGYQVVRIGILGERRYVVIKEHDVFAIFKIGRTRQAQTEDIENEACSDFHSLFQNQGP